MSPAQRLLVALAALAIGFVVGLVLRQRRARPGAAVEARPDLSPGVFVVSAPYCTRCTDLLRRLAARPAPVSVLDARDHPDLLDRLDVRAAPTVLVVDGDGRVRDREHRDFSDDRLSALLAAAG